ncbi:hypothetical protein [Cysteiniphilum sp. 6C5]|uniref:hypothetical protein n=1 Tax=unclassified Cysteiniphilum TaxID=2610889 RepID=UPI003F87254A
MPNDFENKVNSVEMVKKAMDYAHKLNLPLVNSTIRPLVLYAMASVLSKVMESASSGYLPSDKTHEIIQNTLTFLLGNVVAPLAATQLYKIVGDFFTIKNIDKTDKAEISDAESLRRSALFVNLFLRINGSYPIINRSIDLYLSLYNFREWIYLVTGSHPLMFGKTSLDAFDIDFFNSRNLDYAFVSCKDAQGKTCFETKFNVPLIAKLYPHKVGYLPGKWCKDNDKWVFATTVSKDELIRECDQRYQQNWFTGGGKVSDVVALTALGKTYDIHYYKPMLLTSDSEKGIEDLNNRSESAIYESSKPVLVKFDQTKKTHAANNDRLIHDLKQVADNKYENVFWVKQQENVKEKTFSQ